MKPCTVLRPNGEKVPAHIIRIGPKNCRVTFDGGVSSQLVPSNTVYEIMESSTPTPAAKPYVHLCTQAAELDTRIGTELTAAGLTATSMNLQEKYEVLRCLRDGTHVVQDGDLWPVEEEAPTA